jgi:hypothetical protein
MTRTQYIIFLALLIALAVAQYLLSEGYLKPWSSLTGQALASSGLVARGTGLRASMTIDC